MRHDKPGTFHGTVSTRDGGRKIDTLTFRMDDPDNRSRNNKIDFEVYLLSDRQFVVKTDHIPKERWQNLKGYVLNDLAMQAETAAREEFELRLGLTWSNWLEVRVSKISESSVRDCVAGARAQVSYSSLPRGERADGKAFTTSQNQTLISFPENVGVSEGEYGVRSRADLKDEDMVGLSESEKLRKRLSGMDSRDSSVQFTYIPDTPEARAGLDAIIAAIDMVNHRLQAFLQPEAITHTLVRAASSGPALLTGPEETQNIAKSKGPR